MTRSLLVLALVAGVVVVSALATDTTFRVYSRNVASQVRGITLPTATRVPTAKTCFLYNGNSADAGFLVNVNGVGRVCCEFAGTVSRGRCNPNDSCERGQNVEASSNFLKDVTGKCLIASFCYAFDSSFDSSAYQTVSGTYASNLGRTECSVLPPYAIDALIRKTNTNSNNVGYIVGVGTQEYACADIGSSRPYLSVLFGGAATSCVYDECSGNGNSVTATNNFLYGGSTTLCYANCVLVPAAGCGDTLTSASNCGSCGAACSSNNIPTPTCLGGTCNGVCSSGFADCNNNKQTDGCEKNLNSDAGNCGTCGKTCSNNNIASPTCSNGVCGGTCGSGFADCDGNPDNGCEKNLNSDASNCGTCGKTCSNNNIASPTCSNGVCGGTCGSGFADCDGNPDNGCEVNITVPERCGTCTRNCPTLLTRYGACIRNPTTNALTCGKPCANGYADCDNLLPNGCETNLVTSLTACGACGVACSNNNLRTRVCNNGVCDGVCQPNFGDCNNNKQVDGCEASLVTSTNCGACGNQCASPATCQLVNGTPICVRPTKRSSSWWSL